AARETRVSAESDHRRLQTFHIGTSRRACEESRSRDCRHHQERRGQRTRAVGGCVITLQAQREVQSVIFGPYESRRLGRSLGVNPLPKGSRLCNFDCVYCECATGSWPLQWELRPQFPGPETIADALLPAA